MILRFLSSLAIVATANAAAAQGELPSTVDLVVGPCDLPTGRRLRSLLRVELRSDGVEEVRVAGAAEGQALALIRVTPDECTEDNDVFVITIDDTTTQKVVRRSVSLAAVGSAARPRALALAVAELLRASWAELAFPTAIEHQAPLPVREAVVLRLDPTPRPRPVVVETAEAPMRREPRTLGAVAALAVVANGFPAGNVVQVGGELSGSLPLHRHVRLGVGALASTGRVGRPEGNIDLSLFAGSVAVGGSLSIHPLTLVLSAVATVGYGRAEGSSDDETSLRELGGGHLTVLIGGRVEGFVSAADPFLVVVSLEAGGAALGIDAQVDGEVEGGLRGFYLRGTLGLGLAF
ncbi:MAG: hypothetical protein AAGF12_16295 [Myxococcota bacterium]